MLLLYKKVFILLCVLYYERISLVHIELACSVLLLISYIF